MEEGIAILVVNDKKRKDTSAGGPSMAPFKDRNIYDFDRDLLTSIVKTSLGFKCICRKNEHENIGELYSNREEFEATREHLTACAEDKTVHVDKKTGKKEEEETTKNINSGGNDAHFNKDLSVDELAHPTGIQDPKECGCLQCKVRVKAGKSEAKYFLCAISSHGAEMDGQMSILFSAEKLFSLSDIIEKFSDKACPELKGMIKIFIIQACRGDPKKKPEERIDKGAEVQIANDAADSKQTDSAETSNDLFDMEDSPETGQISIAAGSIPPNTLLIFSCWSGRPSYRTVGELEKYADLYGSWMIREMKKVYDKEEGTINFQNTLTKVAAAVAKRETRDGCKSTMTIMHTLTQPIYFTLRNPADELNLDQANIN